MRLQRIAFHGDAGSRRRGNLIAPAADHARGGEVLVQAIDVLDRPLLEAAADRDVVEDRGVLHVFAPAHATHVRADRDAEVSGRATSSKNASARQVAISWTRGAFIFGTLTNPDLRIHAHWAPLASFA